MALQKALSFQRLDLPDYRYSSRIRLALSRLRKPHGALDKTVFAAYSPELIGLLS